MICLIFWSQKSYQMGQNHNINYIIVFQNLSDIDIVSFQCRDTCKILKEHSTNKYYDMVQLYNLLDVANSKALCRLQNLPFSVFKMTVGHKPFSDQFRCMANQLSFRLATFTVHVL